MCSYRFFPDTDPPDAGDGTTERTIILKRGRIVVPGVGRSCIARYRLPRSASADSLTCSDGTYRWPAHTARSSPWQAPAAWAARSLARRLPSRQFRPDCRRYLLKRLAFPEATGEAGDTLPCGLLGVDRKRARARGESEIFLRNSYSEGPLPNESSTSFPFGASQHMTRNPAALRSP